LGRFGGGALFAWSTFYAFQKFAEWHMKNEDNKFRKLGYRIGSDGVINLHESMYRLIDEDAPKLGSGNYV
ncbi:MAG: hypothetical protein V1900_00005, partial [Candidatus Aenigmatarchaeota archaeon]